MPIERARDLPSRLRQMEADGVLVRRPRRPGAIRPLQSLLEGFDDLLAGDLCDALSGRPAWRSAGGLPARVE